MALPLNNLKYVNLPMNQNRGSKGLVGEDRDSNPSRSPLLDLLLQVTGDVDIDLFFLALSGGVGLSETKEFF